MTDTEKTTEELNNEKNSIKVGGKITIEENNRRWARVFEIEKELKTRGEQSYATYNED